MTQKELLKTLKALKRHLPAEKRNKCKSSTLNALKYALRCVKQVKGEVARTASRVWKPRGRPYPVSCAYLFLILLSLLLRNDEIENKKTTHEK